MPFDVLSCNAGSQVPFNTLSLPEGGDIFPVKPIEGLARARERIIARGKSRSLHVAIVGGGPSAMEIAGNVHQLAHEKNLLPPEITIVAGHAILPHAPERVRNLTARYLERRGISILTDTRVRKVRKESLLLDSGESLPADIIFLAIGVKPSPIFSKSGLPVGPDGGLRVNKYLQSIAEPNIFGGGDCIYFEPYPLDKVGVYAVRQNPVLLHNLMAAFAGTPFQEFHPGGKYLLIYNLGDGYGVFNKWSLTFGGRLSFRIKDYIDRRFMHTFQADEH
ncbi:MAG TPA: pyridine nucleotide-disulfide oxidoreductase [Desulfobulbaceae bacterium]|nr:pyridine nucleotide-disulfide oxidoreductase [Desulfobulbaceae bacterium]